MISCGVQEVQGYLIAQPLRFAKFSHLLRRACRLRGADRGRRSGLRAPPRIWTSRQCASSIHIPWYKALTMFSAFEAANRMTSYAADMRRNHLIAAAGICLALVIYATLVRLAGKPVLVGHAEAHWIIVIERFSVYSLLGFFLSFLLPGGFVAAFCLVISVAIGLEFAQTLIPDYDFAFLDVLQKATGGIVGVFLAQTILAFLPRPPA